MLRQIKVLVSKELMYSNDASPDAESKEKKKGRQEGKKLWGQNTQNKAVLFSNASQKMFTTTLLVRER